MDESQDDANADRTPGENTPGEKLSGRVALVTGGVRGIGAAISHSLASQGASVAAGYGGNTAAAQQLLENLAKRYGTEPKRRFTVHSGNVAEPQDCRRVVDEVIEQHGRLDILVNNAGINIDRSTLKMSPDDWQKVLAVNLSGAFFMAQAVLPHMLERGSGRIVNVSSMVAETGNIGQANYTASKSGLFGLTKTLAKEMAFLLERSGKLTEDSIGITVNTVTPGLVATEMLSSVPQKVIDGMLSQIPARRIGRPEEIARVVHFLAADASSYITGQVWAVNGGWDM